MASKQTTRSRVEQLEHDLAGRDNRIVARLRSVPGAPTFDSDGLLRWVKETVPGATETPRDLIASDYLTAALDALPADPRAAGLAAALKADARIVAVGFDAARAEHLQAYDDAEWHREAGSYWARNGGHPSLKHFPPGCLPPLLDAEGRPRRA